MASGTTRDPKTNANPAGNSDIELPARFVVRTAAAAAGTDTGDTSTQTAKDSQTGLTVRVRHAKHVKTSNGISLAYELAFCSRVEHPNIPKVLHCAASPAGLTGVLSQPPGENLETLFAQSGSRSSELEVLQYGLKIAHIATAAHAARFLLLEIGPDNFFVNPSDSALHLERATVCLPLESVLARERMSELLVGLPGYMAPEQVTDASLLGPHTDVFGIGATLFRLLAGKPIYEGGSIGETLAQTRQAKVPDLGKLRKGLNPQTVQLVMSCLGKQPKQRPATAEELAAALRGLLKELGCKPLPVLERFKPQEVPSGLPAGNGLTGLLKGHVDDLCAHIQASIDRKTPVIAAPPPDTAKAEKQRRERDQQEQERKEREQAERERIVRERAEAERKERERLERERLEKEEREQAERERIVRERAEAERKERERLERERLKKEEREQAERERIVRERAEAERKERERLERERLEKEEREQAERQSREMKEQEQARVQKEEQAKARQQAEAEQRQQAVAARLVRDVSAVKVEAEAKIKKDEQKPRGGVEHMATQASSAVGAAREKSEAAEPKTLSSTEVLSRIQAVPAERYQFKREINLGGQGACKVAFDQLAEREVIIKVSSAQNGWAAERIVKEARFSAKMNHPNVCRLLEMGSFGKDQVFMSMPYVEGASLDVVIKKISEAGIPGLTGYSVTAVAELFDKICAGVEHAHSNGLLHLDLKPQNVVVGNRGEVVVVDWGIAQAINAVEYPRRFASNEQPATPALMTTLTGSLAGDPSLRAIGTPACMAPEQWAGDPGTFTERTDVYGLGGILFFLLTGGAPNQIQRATDLDPYFRHSPTPQPSEFTRRRVPPELESLCVKCLARDPAQRFPSVFHVRHILKSWLSRPEMWELYRTSSSY